MKNVSELKPPVRRSFSKQQASGELKQSVRRSASKTHGSAEKLVSLKPLSVRSPNTAAQKPPSNLISAKARIADIARGAPPPKPDRIALKPGDLVPSETSRYVVGELLGSGGFGDVYKVTRQGTSEVYALKTESVHASERLRRLKMECEVLGICAKTFNKRPHFLYLIDRGQTPNFKYIVMPYVGLTLDRIRSKYIPSKQFSPKTAHRICVQMLESLRDLHNFGYIHRDLKPPNYAIGATEEDRCTVFMLDFGVARKILDKEGKLMVPRCRVAFMGTQRFAPRAAHRLQEQSRKDDLESLCFVMADVFDDKNLPWRGQKDRNLVLQLKENFMVGRGSVGAEIFSKLPKEVVDLIRITEKMVYDDEPDYEKMVDDLRTPVKDCTDPYDWVAPGAYFSKLAVIERLKTTGGTPTGSAEVEAPLPPSNRQTTSMMMTRSTLLNKSVIKSKISKRSKQSKSKKGKK